MSHSRVDFESPASGDGAVALRSEQKSFGRQWMIWIAVVGALENKQRSKNCAVGAKNKGVREARKGIQKMLFYFTCGNSVTIRKQKNRFVIDAVVRKSDELASLGLVVDDERSWLGWRCSGSRKQLLDNFQVPSLHTGTVHLHNGIQIQRYSSLKIARVRQSSLLNHQNQALRSERIKEQ